MRRLLASLLIVCALCAGGPIAAHATDALDAFVEELLAVADGEMGYKRARNGYTKYAEWGGGNKYGEWCSEFMSWCVAQADERLSTGYLGLAYPMQTACSQGVRWFTERGRYVSATGTLKGYGAQWYWEDGVPLSERLYIPRPGDLIYFEWYQYNRIDHVGIVEWVEINESGCFIHTIEGNGRLNGKKVNMVERFAYPLDDPSIRAYGITRDDVGTDLRRGSEGLPVERLQQVLADGGFADFKPDGQFGARTERAVRDAQEAHGLEATGVADWATQRILFFPSDD